MARTAAAVYFLLLLGSPAFAAENAAPALPARVLTHHTLTLAGRTLDYDAIAETFALKNAEGATTAQIFTVSYLAAGATGGTRPVTFAFNGGPGAAAVFLQLGALGPRVLDTPETGAVPAPLFRLIDNPATWLPFTDLVFIDPVGTGFSRGVGKGKNPDAPFWTVHSDLSSLASVVRLWLTRHQRWNAPVYLVGESYGGFRAAALARSLPREVGVTVSGLVLISPALDLSALNQNAHFLAAAFWLPSYAAAATADGDLQGPIDLTRIEHFALSDYLVGLAGLVGDPKPSDPFIAEVAHLVGVPAAIVARHRGRIPRRVFARTVLRSKHEVVSFYDATVARPAPANPRDDRAGDPILGPASAAYTAAFDQYAAAFLGYRTELPYHALARAVSEHWNWQNAKEEGAFGLAMTSLQAALLEHPAIRLMIVNGRYDLVTPYLASRWLVDQLQIPAAQRARIRLEVLPGGHMMYMRPSSRAALARAAASLYAAPAPATP